MENLYYCENCNDSLTTHPKTLIFKKYDIWWNNHKYIKLKLCDPCYKLKKKEQKKGKNNFIIGVFFIFIAGIIIFIIFIPR